MTLVTSKNRITIAFDTGTAAFEDNFGAEVEHVLKAIIKRVNNGHTGGKVTDRYGNPIGEWVSK